MISSGSEYLIFLINHVKNTMQFQNNLETQNKLQRNHKTIYFEVPMFL